MAMLAIIPWASLDEPVQFGDFEVVPFGVAVARGDISPEEVGAGRAVLEAYGRGRAVDQDRTPLLRHMSERVTADLSAERVDTYFAFRDRLAFAVLSARPFFSQRYTNSDNLKLYVQGFTPDSGGGAVVTSRRRDGSTTNILPKGTFRLTRPDHVGTCDLGRDVDTAVLTALEAVQQNGGTLADVLVDVLRLFVGASTDSPDVAQHSELVDIIGAFSRLAGKWDEDGTIRAFLAVLPPSWPESERHYGGKANLDRVKKALASGKSVREIMLRDAYVLRSQRGHGRIGESPYPSLWTEREHLVLLSVALPLYVKALLAREHVYVVTENDLEVDAALDALATLEPFTVEHDMKKWGRIIARAGNRALEERFRAALEAAERERQN
jgi:hypothetical protein